MEPMNRKLDALVAEKVMGNIPGHHFTEGGKYRLFDVPEYSTSWAAMGEVVEKLEGEGWFFFLKSDSLRDDYKWTALFQRVGIVGKTPKNKLPIQQTYDVHRTDRRTPFECVCITALRAKSVPEEEIQEALKK